MSRIPTAPLSAPLLAAVLLAASFLAAPLPALAGPPPQQQVCTAEGLFASAREAFAQGSPALKRYALARLKEMATVMPVEVLQAAVAAEQDPAMLEGLVAALAGKASFSGEHTIVQVALQRAAKDGNPATRAAALRGLHGTPSVEMMEKVGGVSYADFVRDPSPEVREAAVANLVKEDNDVYGGRVDRITTTVVDAALSSPDPKVAAGLLSKVTMHNARREEVEKLLPQLNAESPEVRAAAATALGGVPTASTATARRTLVERYREEKNPEVRKALLASVAQLGLGGAAPVLQSLRGVDPSLAPEVDAWLRAVNSGFQTWPLVKREKDRLTAAR
jgi:HEAT repeat protein